MILPRYCCAILSLPGGELLLERRPEGIAHAPGQLTCFGGRREDGEDPGACVAREVREELGIEPPALALAVELWVGGELIAWFYAGTLSAEDLSRVRTEPGREAVRVAAGALSDHRVSPWHAGVLEAWREGRRRADFRK